MAAAFDLAGTIAAVVDLAAVNLPEILSGGSMRSPVRRSTGELLPFSSELIPEGPWHVAGANHVGCRYPREGGAPTTSLRALPLLLACWLLLLVARLVALLVALFFVLMESLESMVELEV